MNCQVKGAPPVQTRRGAKAHDPPIGVAPNFNPDYHPLASNAGPVSKEISAQALQLGLFEPLIDATTSEGQLAMSN